LTKPLSKKPKSRQFPLNTKKLEDKARKDKRFSAQKMTVKDKEFPTKIERKSFAQDKSLKDRPRTDRIKAKFRVYQKKVSTKIVRKNIASTSSLQ